MWLACEDIGLFTFDPLNKKMMSLRTRAGQVPYGFIINAIFSNEDGVYIATAAPYRLEILLMAADGKISEYYYKNLDEPLGCAGLIVRKNGIHKEFLILRNYPEPGVEILTAH